MNRKYNTYKILNYINFAFLVLGSLLCVINIFLNLFSIKNTMVVIYSFAAIVCVVFIFFIIKLFIRMGENVERIRELKENEIKKDNTK